MRLNVTKVLKREAAEKARVKPLPNVRLKSSSQSSSTTRSPIIKKIVSETPPEVKQKVQEYGAHVMKGAILQQLWDELGSLKRKRGALSSSIAWKVDELKAQLDSGALEEFMKGNLPMPQLESLSSEIQSYTDRMAKVWDNIRHVEQYGSLPAETSASVTLDLLEQSVDVKALHHEIRRLDDLIYKCNKKLRNNNSGIKAPKNTGKVSEWKQKIALAEAQRSDLKLKLKKAQYESRVENGAAQD